MIDRFRKHFSPEELNHWIKMSNDQGRWLVSQKLNNQRGYSLIGDRFDTKEIAEQFAKACIEHEFFQMCYGGEKDIELVVSNHHDLNYNYHVVFRFNNEDWTEIPCGSKEKADEVWVSLTNQFSEKLSNNKIQSYEIIITADSFENLGLEQCLISTGASND